jgi:y4mF family transcriptional regulator
MRFAQTDETRRFGELVRARRREAGLQQRQLALAAGVGERLIVDLEAGKATCQLGKALAVASVLGIGLGAVSPHVRDAAATNVAGYDLPDIEETS